MCKKVGDTTHDRTKIIYTTGAHHHIFGPLNSIITKANMLIEKKTNNRPELFMSILARFNMGKRLNLVQRDAFQMRAYLTGLRYNEGHKWHYKAWEKWTGRIPGKYFKSYMEQQAILQSKRKACQGTGNPNKKFKLQELRGPQEQTDYGSNIAEIELSEEELTSEVNKFIETLKIFGEEDQLRISEETRGQFDNPKYLTQRMHRLTASKFGAVVKRKIITSCDSLVKSILPSKSFTTTQAMEYGKRYESIAVSKFMEQTGHVVEPSGLYIDTEHCFLGASPDGIISKDEIVEVKCLQKVALSKLSLQEAVSRREVACLEFVGNNIRLKHNHDYYYQIQGQLAITKAKICHFIVYTGDNNDLFIESIHKDDLCWQIMLPKLIQFYKNCIGPEIILNRRTKNLKCRDPKYIVEAQQKYAQSGKAKKKSNNL